jgi:hypothetical protein
MSKSKSNMSYENIVNRSRNLTKEIGSLNIEFDKDVIGEFELDIDGVRVSIWSIYEAILAIHFFPSGEKNSFKNFARLIKREIRGQYDVFKKNLPSSNSKENKLKDGKNIYFLGFNGYLASENFDLVYKNILTDALYTPIWIDDKPIDSSWIDDIAINIDDIAININELDSKELRIKTAQIKKNIKNIIRKLVKKIKSSDLDAEKSDLLLLAIAFMRPEIETQIPKYLALASYMLKKVRPVAIVSIDVADPRNRVFTLLANKLAIPVVQVQAGPINQECVEWSFCYDDLMLSHGPSVKPELAKLGFNENHVVNTGSPKLEKVVNIGKRKELCLKSRFMISNSSKVLLFLTSYTGLFGTNNALNDQYRLYEEIYFAVVSEISKRANLSLVIKPHPLETSKQLKQHAKITKNFKNIFLVEASENTSKLIAASDSILSFGSTASIDSIIMGKPVICPKFGNFSLNEYFEKSGAVLVPKSKSELADILDIISSDNIKIIVDRCAKGRGVFLKNFSNLDSSATEKVISHIYGLIKNFDSAI